MTEQTERYDRIAAGYARWWAPVLAPAVEGLLDRTDKDVDRGVTRVLDVGTGTGQLALGALDRWSSISVVGIDASSEMCAMAEQEADRLLTADRRTRFRAEVAPADRLPFEDGAFDLAVASFVLQLVPNRHRALREIRRVLRAGGVFDSVTWVADLRAFEPDAIFDDLLDDIDLDAREPDHRSGDFESAERAANELRRAGFHDVSVTPSWLEHRFSVEGYIAFMVEFDEETLIAGLDPIVRERFIRGLRERLAALSPDQLTMRFPIVFASARN